MTDVRNVGNSGSAPVTGPGREPAPVSAQKAEDAAPAKEGSLLDAVGSGIRDVFETAASGVDAVVDLGSEVVGNAIEPFAPLEMDLGGLVDSMFERAGRTVEAGVQQIESAYEEIGYALSGPVAEGIEGLVSEGRQLGETLLQAPARTLELGKELADRAVELGNRGLELADQAREAVTDAVVQTAGEALDQLAGGAQEVLRAGEELLTDIREAVDVERRIRALNSDGDKVTIGLGGSASVEGVKAYGKGQVEIERKGDPPVYVVSVDGEVGAGIFGEVGGKVGLSASGSAEATQGLGGKVEMTFSSPEEAARAVEIMERMAAAGAVGAAVPVPGAGVAAQAVLGPSSEDMAFLLGNVSAVQLRGNVAAQAAGVLGVGLDESIRLAGLDGKVHVKGELAVRLELPRDGKPARVVVSQELTGGATAGAGIGLSLNKGADGGKTGAAVNLDGRVSVKLEQAFILPDHVDAERLLRDPVGELADLAGQVRVGDHSMTIKATGTAAALGNGGGVELELKVSANPEELLRSGVVGRALDGDLEGALRTLGDNTRVEAKLDKLQVSGFKANPEISVMGFGVGVEVEYTTTDREPWVEPFKGTATEAVDELLDRLERLGPQHDPGLRQPLPPPVPGRSGLDVEARRRLSQAHTGQLAPSAPVETPVEPPPADLRPLTIGASVGLGGVNNPEDVRQVQEALHALGYLAEGYEPGRIDPATIDAITDYQRENGLPFIDGRIDVNLYTMRHINERAAAR
jgi:hypothetical protein